MGRRLGRNAGGGNGRATFSPIGIELQGSLRPSPGQNFERVALTSVGLLEVLKVKCDVDRIQAGSEDEEA